MKVIRGGKKRRRKGKNDGKGEGELGRNGNGKGGVPPGCVSCDISILLFFFPSLLVDSSQNSLDLLRGGMERKRGNRYDLAGRVILHRCIFFFFLHFLSFNFLISMSFFNSTLLYLSLSHDYCVFLPSLSLPDFPDLPSFFFWDCFFFFFFFRNF